MTSTEKAIRDFCGHHADWWPSTTQVQEILALAQPCSTCEALARTVMLDQTSHDTTPQAGDIRALKHRIHELEGELMGYKKIVADQDATLERQTARIVGLQDEIRNLTGEEE
jgi:bacterioferritin-associated ferredoxin